MHRQKVHGEITMSMKNASSPRRLYARAGQLLVTFGGCYFGPGAKSKTAIDAAGEVRIEVRPRSHGKGRITVYQGEVVENWSEQHITFGTRKPAASVELSAAAQVTPES